MRQLLQQSLKIAAVLVPMLAAVVASEALASARLNGQGLLWRIEGFGYEPSHVFGTMHVSDERVLRLPQPVLDAFDRSRVCLFELIVPDDAFVGLAERMLLPDGLTLDRVLDAETYAKVVAEARRYGFTTRQISRTRPSGLMFVFSQPVNEWRRRLDGWTFLDHALQNEARAMNKPVYPLETIVEQLAILDVRERYRNPALLQGLIEQSRMMEQGYESMIQHYLRADMDAIFSQQEAQASSLSYDAQQELAAFNEQLLDRRNRVMVERVLPYLAAGRAFVAIGAAHLAGTEGVLNFLTSKGYRVTRVY